ncbi:MAG: transketolase family protein [Clostridium sp.]|jgi:transketolase|nr:transketolase family protein [Clostridium sp.]
MGAFDIELYRKLGTRDALGETLAEIGGDYPDLVVLAADCLASVRGTAFSSKFPERAFNFGIAEANMMMAAAGMATCGKIPVACTFGFLASLRAGEMIRSGICYPGLNVKIAATSSGLAMGTGGTTHHIIEDIAVLRSFANLTILAPCDGVATTKAVRAAIEYPGPVYLRLGRGGEPNVYKEDFNWEIGKAVTVRDGSDVTIIAVGAVVPRALEAADILAAKGVSARVIDIMTLKPIDREIILKAADETKLIVTAEDHNILGGLGGAVAEVLSEHPSVPLRRVGIRDTFCSIGPTDELMDKYGLSGEAIAEEALKF